MLFVRSNHRFGNHCKSVCLPALLSVLILPANQTKYLIFCINIVSEETQEGVGRIIISVRIQYNWKNLQVKLLPTQAARQKQSAGIEVCLLETTLNPSGNSSNTVEIELTIDFLSTHTCQLLISSGRQREGSSSRLGAGGP